MEWWRCLLVWFLSIFTKSEEKRAHPPPPLKPKRIRRKEEKRERKLQRRAEKREEALQVPPEQRLLEEQANMIEEVADLDSKWPEVEESQAGKLDEDTLTNPSHPLHSSDILSRKEFCEPSEDESSEDVEENSTKSSHLTPSSACSKGQRIRHKEEKRERNRQKKWERKEQAAATRLFMIPIERIIGGALAEKEEPPVPQTRGAAALEGDSTIRNKKERRARKRQRRAERKETSSQVPSDPTQDSCYSDEAEELYDEWATEKTMQLLSGEVGGPNLLQNLFGMTREGDLIEEDEPSMVRLRGGACEDDPNICKVCKRSFQRLLKHLASSADCAQEYDLQKMHEENKAKSAAKGVESKRNKRKAERAEDEPAFKAKAAAQRTNHRQVERAENEPAFKAKAAAQKKINDNALRAKDEEGFRSKVAAKKTNQRDVSRAQNEEEFKAKRAVEKQHEREALRAQNEEEFKAKRAAQEKKRQDSLREKDEPRLKQEAAVKKKNQREVLRTENEAKLRGKWAAEKKISEIGR